jgi:hypothetical protein
MDKRIEGFSKLTKAEKIDWITQAHFKNPTTCRISTIRLLELRFGFAKQA